MAYSDYEMKNFTQVAYADFGKAYDYLHSCCPEQDSFTIAELKAVAEVIDSNADLSSLRCLDENQMSNWRISVVHDTNAKNGFYACIIETSPGQAAVAFRGSESNDFYDWVGSDFGLLNSVCTIEQRETDRFLSKYSEKISNYDSVAMTGHSLGGNLAEYATLVSRNHGIRNVEQCISFDGPGFSNEFLMFHSLDILAMNGVMTHYRWSVVGNLLFEIPGVQYQDVRVSNSANTRDSDKMGSLTRHDTKYLEFEEGSVVPLKENENKDLLSIGGSIISKSFDWGVPTPVFHIFLLTAELFSEFKDDAKQILDTLVGGATTTYKNLNDIMKKLFRVNTAYLSVDINCLARDSDSLNSCIQRVRNRVSEMFSAVENLGTMWKGKANQAFAEKFASEKDLIFDYLDEITVYVASIKTDSDAYKRCESYCAQAVDSVRV